MPTQSKSQSVSTVIEAIAAGANQVSELKSDRIVLAFERQILSGGLPAGARLPTEGELCEILDVSRSVIRDSVRTLVARGLLTVRQGRGTTVAQPSDEAFSSALLVLLARFGFSMGDVFQARATIDTSLVGLAAKNGTAEDWQALEATYDAFAEAVKEGDVEAAARHHTNFHSGILEAVHQPALALMLRPMTDLTMVSGAASTSHSGDDWAVESHAPILAALKAGDPEAATTAMSAHYEIATAPEVHKEFLALGFADAYFGDGLR